MNASEKIDELAAGLTDWHGETFRSIRKIIHDADSEITEEWKWMGAPVFSDRGIICVMNVFKDKIKLTFYDGAKLPDPDKLFNNGLDGNKWRTIDYYEGDKINENSLKTLINAAVDFNHAKGKTAAKPRAASSKTQKRSTK